MTKVGIIGGGAFGTSLAVVAANAGHETYIWARNKQVVSDINQAHENKTYLADFILPSNIKATDQLADMAKMDILLWATPAQITRHVVEQFTQYLQPHTSHLICAKGIEQSSRKLMSQMLEEFLPKEKIGVLSGPSFAVDIAKGLPTAITLAMEDEALGVKLAKQLSIPTFRLYHTRDIIGAQIGGAVKNVLAIACGIAHGKGLGDSSKAAITTRGFAELTRFGAALGAKKDTLFGLSGLGDLTLSASSLTSRNMSLGAELGAGKTLEDILNARNTVSEGVHTAPILAKWADELGVDMPICHTIANIVAGVEDVDSAITRLLNRPLKKES